MSPIDVVAGPPLTLHDDFRSWPFNTISAPYFMVVQAKRLAVLPQREVT